VACFACLTIGQSPIELANQWDPDTAPGGGYQRQGPRKAVNSPAVIAPPKGSSPLNNTGVDIPSLGFEYDSFEECHYQGLTFLLHFLYFQFTLLLHLVDTSELFHERQGRHTIKPAPMKSIARSKPWTSSHVVRSWKLANNSINFNHNTRTLSSTPRRWRPTNVGGIGLAAKDAEVGEQAPEPLTIQGIKTRREKAGKLIAGTAAYSDSDMFKSPV
jgi:hypothetical protein